MTTAEFKSYFSEFSAVSDGTVQRAIDLATCSASANCCGELAFKYLTAAYLVAIQNQIGGVANPAYPVSSESDGSASASYATNSNITDELLYSNSYGQMYKKLTKKLFAMSI